MKHRTKSSQTDRRKTRTYENTKDEAEQNGSEPFCAATCSASAAPILRTAGTQSLGERGRFHRRQAAGHREEGKRGGPHGHSLCEAKRPSSAALTHMALYKDLFQPETNEHPLDAELRAGSVLAGAQCSVRYRHLIQSQRVWLNRAKEHAVNDRSEKAIKALNECLEILRLLEGIPPNE